MQWEFRTHIIVISMLCCAIVSSMARADIVMPLPNGFTALEDLGSLRILRTYEPERGAPTCFPPNQPISEWCRIVSIAAEWSPTDFPVSLTLDRDDANYTLRLSSLLRNRKAQPLCWSERTLSTAEAANARRLWTVLQSEFDHWNTSCPINREIGIKIIRTAFLSVRADILRAYETIHRVRSLSPSESHFAGVGSFIPTQITQSLLNAISLACDGPSERLRLLSDGTISWHFNPNVPYGADGAWSFDSCVDGQIHSFPGYPR